VIVRAGMRFGRLTTVSLAGRSNDGHRVWLCRCDCGSECTRQSNNLQVRAVVSCGCAFSDVHARHGMRGTPTYSSWQAAKQRCTNPADKDWPNYGGRGIRMCDEWQQSFEAFHKALGDRPEGTTLERQNVNGNYEPGNCVWGTFREQCLNKRNSVYVDWKGQRQHISVAAAELGITLGAAHLRHKRGKLHAIS
jgi:hypothetical protein